MTDFTEWNNIAPGNDLLPNISTNCCSSLKSHNLLNSWNMSTLGIHQTLCSKTLRDLHVHNIVLTWWGICVGLMITGHWLNIVSQRHRELVLVPVPYWTSIREIIIVLRTPQLRWFKLLNSVTESLRSKRNDLNSFYCFVGCSLNSWLSLIDRPCTNPMRSWMYYVF